MTKNELRTRLNNGEIMNDLFNFTPGQECDIYKANEWNSGDEIIYIPDIYLNNILIDQPIPTECEINEILDNCYTGKNFLELCENDEEIAIELFNCVDWQHPSSLYNELFEDKVEVNKIFDKIKSYLFSNRVDNSNTLYHYLYDAYEIDFWWTALCVTDLTKKLINEFEYKAASKLLHEFNIVCETFKVG